VTRHERDTPIEISEVRNFLSSIRERNDVIGEFWILRK
jgi:hypothetical protein